MKYCAPFTILVALLLLTQCDSGQEKRIDRLEAEIREIRSDTRDQVNGLGDRVEAAEAKVGTSSSATNLEERFTTLNKPL